MNKKCYIVMMLILILLTISVGCSNSQSSSDSKGPSGATSIDGESQENKVEIPESGIVPIYTPPTGGTSYILAAGMGQLFNQMKIAPQANLVTEATSGASEAAVFLSERYDQGKPAFANISFDAVTKIYNGELERAKGARKELRAISWTNSTAFHFVVSANSPIKSLADLKGVRVGFAAPPGNSATDFAMMLLGEGYGITPADYKAIILNHPDVMEGIQNGSLDIGGIIGAVPSALINELGHSHDIRIISVDEEIINKFISKHPYYGSTLVRAGTYPIKEDQDILIGTFEAGLVTHEGVSEELVYQFTKLLLENTEELSRVHPSAADITPEKVLQGFQIPLHPGAERYYKEIGVIK